MAEEIPLFSVSERPLRHKELWDLTLTCRTLTSSWVCSPARSWRSKAMAGQSLQGASFCRIPACPLRPASSTEAEKAHLEDGLIKDALSEALDSPGLSTPTVVSLVWVPLVSPVTGTILRRRGRPRDEGREAQIGGLTLRESGRWMVVVGGGGRGPLLSTCLCTDLSSSSCLRNRLFSWLRLPNYREKKERNIHREAHVQTKRLICLCSQRNSGKFLRSFQKTRLSFSRSSGITQLESKLAININHQKWTAIVLIK